MHSFSHDHIKSINKAKSSKDDNYVKIEMSTTGGDVSLVVEYDQFCKWVHKNKKSYKNLYEDFVVEFIGSSTGHKPLSEIIDTDGNLYGDDDKPTNATNGMVGYDLKFDLDKVYQQSIPKSSRVYSGDLGVGSITW